MKKRPSFLIFLIALTSILFKGTFVSAETYSSLSNYLDPVPKKTISMDFKDASLNDVLKIFSQQSGMNFIAASEISTKTVNLYLENVPIEEALERILRANNLTYEVRSDSNIFIVKELNLPVKELITRVYHLKYATVSSSKLKKTFSIDSSGGSSSGGSSSGGSSSGGSSSGGSSSGGSSSGSSSGDSSILSTLKSIVSADGLVLEDARTNSIIVTDIPAQFPIIEQTIARLDIPIPQVLIEVEMLDISKNSADLLGVKWGEAPMTFKGGERDDGYPFLDSPFPFFDQKPVTDAQFEDARYRVSTVSFQGLKFTLNFLKNQTDTKSLARPRILTLNNETASIEILTDEVIGVTQSTTASEGIGTATTTAERTETGVSLKVTPQANLETKDILLAIEPKVTEAKSSSGILASSSYKDPEKRITKSMLRIKDGDTVVLGGLLRTSKQETNTRVPFISKIPIFGSAFKHKDLGDSQRELIIFITPHIVGENLSLAAGYIPDEQNFEREETSSKKRTKEITNSLNHFQK